MTHVVTADGREHACIGAGPFTVLEMRWDDDEWWLLLSSGTVVRTNDVEFAERCSSFNVMTLLRMFTPRDSKPMSSSVKATERELRFECRPGWWLIQQLRPATERFGRRLDDHRFPTPFGDAFVFTIQPEGGGVVHAG